MTIEARLKERLTQSIKARDSRTSDVVRMIMSKVGERRTASGFDGVTDNAFYEDVVRSYRKSLLKAREQFEALGEKGQANVDALDFEIGVCDDYLPQPLGEAEARAAVQEAIAALGATDMKMVGRVIGEVMKKHKGLIDANTVKTIAAEILA